MFAVPDEANFIKPLSAFTAHFVSASALHRHPIRIKEPAKIISCPDDEAATEQARQLLDGTDQSLEVWQSDRRVTLIGPSNKGAKALPMRS